MKRVNVIKVLWLDTVRRVEHVGGGLPVEGKLTTALLVKTYKRQRRICFIRQGNMVHVNAVRLEPPKDFVAKEIVPELCQHTRVAAKFGKGAANVGRRTSDLWCKLCNLIKLTALVIRYKIYQCFAYGE